MSAAILIHNQGSELRADSRQVAKFFEVQHESLIRLITENLPHFEAIGHLRFEIGNGIKREQGGGAQQKYCYLTEPQVGFLLTLTRNTGRTTELKLALIQQFQKARVQLRPVDTTLLSLPTNWQKVFSDDFYHALLGLHGYEFKRSEGTCSWVGAFTNKYIYGPLWDGLSAELKAKRAQRTTENSDDAACLKLHQFLEANAKVALERHVLKVTALLQAAQTPEHFAELFASAFRGQTQMLLGCFTQKKRRAA